MVERGQHFTVGARSEPEGTEFVGVIIAHDLCVAAQPCVGGSGIWDALAIAAKVELDHQRGNVVVALDGGNQYGKALADGVHHTGAGRAGNDQRGDATWPLFGIPARIKAAHAVPVQDNGQTVKTLMQ